jgi:hypothetical protein
MVPLSGVDQPAHFWYSLRELFSAHLDSITLPELSLRIGGFGTMFPPCASGRMCWRWLRKTARSFGKCEGCLVTPEI